MKQPMKKRLLCAQNVPGVGCSGVGWGGSCRGGGVGHTGAGWVMQGWGVSCRGGVGWVM